MLYDDFLKAGNAENIDLVGKLNSQVDRLIRLFNVLLDLTRLTDGKFQISPATFDLNAALEEQVHELQLLSPAHKLRFEPAEIGLVHADRDKIIQVIANLISNAFKYSPPGTDIMVTSEDMLDGAMVRVRDFGMGISAEEKQKIFTPYYRRGEEKVTGQNGFGLGLFICSEIIRQHHGLIGVDSVPGEGSTFYFKLFY